jgi:hypothetical protein
MARGLLEMNLSLLTKLAIVSLVSSALTCAAMIAGMYYLFPLMPLPRFNTLETKRLIIRNQSGNIAAELRSDEETTTLVFFSPNHKELITMGVAQPSASRYLRFLDNKGDIVGAWNHIGKHSEGTFYIGDSEKTARVHLGALDPELTDEPTYIWGLMVRPHLRTSGAVSVYSLKKPDRADWLAGINVVNQGKSLLMSP